MSEVLKGSVGLSTTKRKAKNNKDDILLVRRYLRANGYDVSETGGVNPSLLKALSKAAKRARVDPPIGYIEPNDKIMGTLKKKYFAAQKKEDKKAGGKEKDEPKRGRKEIKMHSVKYGSKKFLMTPEGYLTAKEKLFRSLERYTEQLRKSQAINRKMVIKYTHTMASNDGFLSAISQTVTVKAGRIRPPNEKLSKDASDAVLALCTTMGSRNIKKLSTHLKRAERLVSDSSKDIDRFLKEFIGSAGTVATVLTVTSATGFAIVGAMAAAPVAAATALTAAQAAAASTTSVAVVASLSNDLGKASAGQKITIYQAINNATIDGLVTLATAGIASKLPPDFGKAMAKRIAPKLARNIAGVSAKQITPFLERYLAGAGEEAIKTSVGRGIKAVGAVVKTGATKTPTKKDFETEVAAAFMDIATGGFMKNLTGFETDVSEEVVKEIKSKVIPALIKRTFNDTELTPKQAEAMATAMTNKLAEEATKIGIAEYFKVGTGKETPAKKVEIAKASVLDSYRFQKNLRVAMEAEVAKVRKNK